MGVRVSVYTVVVKSVGVLDGVVDVRARALAFENVDDLIDMLASIVGSLSQLMSVHHGALTLRRCHSA
jgi:hypothetical protein